MSIQLSRILVVGAGAIARRHIANLQQLRPQATVAVLGSPGSLSIDDKSVASNDWFNSLDQAIGFKPEVVVIASPANTHLEYAHAFANIGTHLFIEKPLAPDTSGVQELIEQCRKQELVVAVGYNLRYSGLLLMAKRMLEAQEIGKAIAVRAEVGQYLPDWRPGKEYAQTVSAQKFLGGGALLELSHEIDYISWFFGMPQAVTARGGKYSNLTLDVEDTVEILLEYTEKQILVNIHLDLVQRDPVRSCRIAGERGTILWDGIDNIVKCYHAEDGEWSTFSEEIWKDKNRMYADELEQFIECVETGAEPRYAIEDGLKVLQIIDAARQSIDECRTVVI